MAKTWAETTVEMTVEKKAVNSASWLCVRLDLESPCCLHRMLKVVRMEGPEKKQPDQLQQEPWLLVWGDSKASEW